MQYTFYYVSIVVMLLTLLIHIRLIAAPMIFVPIGFLLAIIFIAIGVIATMKTEVDLDCMFHKNQDEKD
jgi:K+-transporting ATPase A subunit